MSEIGVYIGNSDIFAGQILDTQPWGSCLSKYNTTVYGSATVSDSVRSKLEVYRTTDRNSCTNPLEKILMTYWDTLEFIDEQSPDVLMQIMKYPTHAPGVALAARRSHIPCITRCTGDVFNSYKHYSFAKGAAIFGLKNVIGRIPIMLSKKIIAVGPNIKATLVNRGANQSDVKIIPPVVGQRHKFHPIDNPAEYRQSLGLPENRTIVLTVGRVTRMKGMEFLIDVIERVRRQMDITFVVVGEGPYQRKLNEQFSDTTLRTVGRVPHEEIDQYYKAADVYLHPSPHEGLPLAVLEAQACSVPVIARDAGDVGFATPNVVSTPKKAAERLVNSEYSANQCNREYFTDEHMMGKFDEILKASKISIQSKTDS